MGAWSKFATAVLFTALYGVSEFLTDGNMSTTDWIQFIEMVGVSAAVAIVPNTPWLAKAKTWVAGLPILTGVIALQIADGWQWHLDAAPIALAAGAVVGVWAVPNKNYPPLQGTAVRREL